jgi:hypothetical protein
VLVQAFKEDRHLRRDGQETFSYGVITAAQAANSGNPALAGLRMPGLAQLRALHRREEALGWLPGLQGPADQRHRDQPERVQREAQGGQLQQQPLRPAHHHRGRGRAASPTTRSTAT